MDAEVSTARAPHRLWPEWRFDAVVAGVVVVLQVAFTALASRHQHPHRDFTVAAVLLLAVGPVSLLVRRRYPRLVLGFVFVSTLAYWTADFPKGPIFFALIVAFVTVVLDGDRAFAVGVVVVGWAAFLWVPWLFERDSGPGIGAIVGLAAWLLVLLSGSEIARTRRERAIERAQTRDESARRRASEERVRIAQDLHDVLAHNISLINVQAGVALHLGDELPDSARDAFQAIKIASRDALGELRSVLDILRDPEHDLPRAPVPGLGDVDALVARVDAAGLRVASEVTGSPRPLPTSVDVAAYRIVQEALTNVVRHAGPAHARVRIEYRADEVVIEVVDDGVGARNGHGATDGNGIAGMRERATAVGGRLQAGGTPDGGFRVRAELPTGLPVGEPA
ncbi:MAG TPA: sensor histidine kinase [Acidimicrobiia bacterium]|nr:sensor histidine kinase [Acidimicrobiia bacterium]